MLTVSSALDDVELFGLAVSMRVGKTQTMSTCQKLQSDGTRQMESVSWRTLALTPANSTKTIQVMVQGEIFEWQLSGTVTVSCKLPLACH